MHRWLCLFSIAANHQSNLGRFAQAYSCIESWLVEVSSLFVIVLGMTVPCQVLPSKQRIWVILAKYYDTPFQDLFKHSLDHLRCVLDS
jgi:hypothetical protein